MRRLPVPLLLALALLAGCTGGDGGEEPPADPPGTVRVLAGSELRDVEPLLGQIRDATGVNLKFEYSGTLEGAERITAGGPRPELAWFSSARHLALLSAGVGQGRPLATERIMLSPVVLGVKRSVATRFGWAGNPDVTWKDIAAKARAGQLRYGMTNPAASNSGFSALVGVAAAMAGTGDALRSEDVDERGLTDFFNGQTLTAGSSGWLADAFVTGQAKLDGLINYESVLLGLNASGRLREPLELIYPRDGIITADYPLLLLDPARRGEYDKLVAYLRGPEEVVHRDAAVVLAVGHQHDRGERALVGPGVGGGPLDDFLGSLRSVPEPARSTKTFAIQFGEANPDELRRIVQTTAGAMFDANRGSLAAAFKEIRGYQ